MFSQCIALTLFGYAVESNVLSSVELDGLKRRHSQVSHRLSAQVVIQSWVSTWTLEAMTPVVGHK